jgi:opacity protein-like surface antigen
MNTRRQRALTALAATLLVGWLGTNAAGAEFVVVTATRGPIRADATTKSALVATVAKGTRLEVVAKAGDWYRVLLPPDKQGTRLAGYIQAGLVAAEAAAAPVSQPAAGKSAGSGARPAATPKKPSRYTFRGFGSLEYEFFQASRSFDAVFQNSTGLLYGGGVEVSIGPQWFVQGRLSYLSKTGERAFVYNGEVSRLGITETVSMMPVDASVGYRVTSQPGFMPYVAGGIGSLSYNEQSASGDSSDNSTGTFLSYHVAGGVEVPIVKRWFSVAGEFQYRGVPGAIGSAGVSKQFGETNLGGMSVCMKFLVGPQPARKARAPKPAGLPPKPPVPKR